MTYYILILWEEAEGAVCFMPRIQHCLELRLFQTKALTALLSMRTVELHITVTDGACPPRVLGEPQMVSPPPSHCVM